MISATQPKPILLIALGGNAMIRKGQEGLIEQQLDNLKLPVRQIAQLSRDYSIIITHGNGPQVGNLLLQQECCDAVPKLPLEILVAQTEGQIGYMIESTLDSELMALGINDQLIVSLLTYVVVDKNDPAFSAPSKPIGPGFTDGEAAGLDYPTIETAQGYRRVVASPKPVTIIEKREIKKLIETDFIVICCGGGGIPVIRKGRAFNGVDAVIDKDLVSALLAEEVGADLFVIATDIQGVMLNFGTANPKLLDTVTVAAAARFVKEGHFQSGSMLPKVQAAIQFTKRSRKRTVITSINAIEKAVKRKAGTAFIPESEHESEKER